MIYPAYIFSSPVAVSYISVKEVKTVKITMLFSIEVLLTHSIKLYFGKV